MHVNVAANAWNSQRTRSSSHNDVNPSSSAPSVPSQVQLDQTLLIPFLLFPLVILFFLFYSYFPPTPLPNHFQLTTLLYCISAWIELGAERSYLATLKEWETLTSKRVRIEGLAVVGKAIGTLITVRYGGEGFSLLAFGVGQIVYSSTLWVGFYFAVGSKRPRQNWGLVKVEIDGEKEHVPKAAYFDAEMKELSWALTKQSFVKQLLTEGDKIVVGRISKVEDQGGYAVALNYGKRAYILARKYIHYSDRDLPLIGSLIARILFQPLEESSRLFFSRSLSSPTPASLLASAKLLSSILLLHTHLSLIFILLAPAYTSPLLFHLLGPRWAYPLSSAPLILRAYCVYLPFLAINGVTEAFFQSVADPIWLQRGSRWMGVCSVGFLLAVAGGVKAGQGETGLVYANCVNMAMRIAFSGYFIRSYFRQHRREDSDMDGKQGIGGRTALEWRKWTPKGTTVVTFILSSIAVNWSEQRNWKTMRGLAEHVVVGAGVGIVCLAVMCVNVLAFFLLLPMLMTRTFE